MLRSIRKIWKGLAKTREKLAGRLQSLLGRAVDEDLLDELEETLYLADLGTAASAVIQDVREAAGKGEASEAGALRDVLRRSLLDRLGPSEGLRWAAAGPTVVLIVGVNGTGKTTTVGKLAGWLRAQGKRVVIAAADTFRAAAVQQLVIWSERAGVQIVRHREGGDPAAVVYDAAEAAVARGAHVLLVDTAGRLHTKEHLMRELEKIHRVLRKKIPEAPHESLLVLDATTGQNAIRQAEEFRAAAAVSGLVLAKLDGTAKGGAVFGIRDKVGLPIKFVGTGEGIEDLEIFDPEAFVESILGTPQSDPPSVTTS